MGQKRKRRSKRHGYRKLDPIIATLATIAIFLSIVWAALYWNESSGRALIVHADQAEVINGESPMPDDKAALQESEAGWEPDRETDTETDTETTVDNNNETNEDTQNPISDSNSTTNTPEPSSAAETHSPNGPESHSSSADATESPSDHESENPSEVEHGVISDSESDKPIASDTGSPSESPSNTPISVTEQYESEITQVQAMCTKEMKEVIAGAESSMEQLDRRNPIAVQSWNEKWTKKLAEAESECDGEFQEVILEAEQHSISEEIIEEWKQTFVTSKEELQVQSKAKLVQLMGG